MQHILEICFFKYVQCQVWESWYDVFGIFLDFPIGPISLNQMLMNLSQKRSDWCWREEMWWSGQCLFCQRKEQCCRNVCELVPSGSHLRLFRFLCALCVLCDMPFTAHISLECVCVNHKSCSLNTSFLVAAFKHTKQHVYGNLVFLVRRDHLGQRSSACSGRQWYCD